MDGGGGIRGEGFEVRVREMESQETLGGENWTLSSRDNVPARHVRRGIKSKRVKNEKGSPRKREGRSPDKKRREAPSVTTKGTKSFRPSDTCARVF